MLAASLDQVLPDKAAYVNSRTHSPLIISAIGCDAFLNLIIYDPGITSYSTSAGHGTQIAYILISVRVVLFPFRKKEIFGASPAGEHKIGGFPLLSILGILSLIFNLFVGWIFVARPAFIGLTAPTTTSIEFVFEIFLA